MSAAPTASRTRADLEVEIASLLAKYRRMPAHWEARRIATMRIIEDRVDEWLALDG
jgi:hypothetical protein